MIFQLLDANVWKTTSIFQCLIHFDIDTVDAPKCAEFHEALIDTPTSALSAVVSARPVRTEYVTLAYVVMFFLHV